MICVYNMDLKFQSNFWIGNNKVEIESDIEETTKSMYKLEQRIVECYEM